MGIITITAMVMVMTDEKARIRHMYKLMTWLSPAFPVGAFSHSTGLESAIASGLVADLPAMRAWLADLLRAGTLWSDAVIFARAHDAATEADTAGLSAIWRFANAFPGTAELRAETRALGTAFCKAAGQAWQSPLLEAIGASDPPYPVAVAVASAGHGIAVAEALPAFMHASAANLVSVAVRLVPLGQSDAVKLVADIECLVLAAAQKAAATGLDDLSTACLMPEIASMRHEIQKTRLFST